MRYIGIIFLVANFVVLQYNNGIAQILNSTCITESGKNGVCLYLERCPQALELVKNERDVEICDFGDVRSIVCCERKIAQEKCRDYFREVPLQKIRRKRIVGGIDARPKEFPHMALLGYGEPNNILWLCGGTLISEQFVLTAASCIFARNYGKVKYIRLGELDLTTTTDDAQVRNFEVQEALLHPDYKVLSNYYDIALLRMKDSISFNSYIRPACLAVSSNVDGLALVAVGWGLTEQNGIPANVLQKVTLSHVPNDACRKIYGTSRNIQNGIMEATQICADGGSVRRDTCQGDSGGPLQYTNYDSETDFGGFIEIVGVTSFGKGCGRTAGVFTRVLPFVPWIENIVWPR